MPENCASASFSIDLKSMATPQQNMTTLASFNHMLKEFVDELSTTFPEYPQIALFKAGLPAMLEADERRGLDMYMAAVSPHGDKIMSGDESFFQEDMDLGMGLKLNELWNAEGLDDETRKAIFSYVSTLFVLGMTIQALDPSILNGIEDIAKNAAASMKESGSLDMTQMLPQMMQQVGSLMGVGAPDTNDPKFQSLMGMIGQNLTAGGVSDILPALGDGGDEEMDDAEA